ncbi:MAG: tetratricopeptide repeat protein [Anaerolineae bacterium]|nr:tetratricopeptide repeat protein [Anaerolineae bacterium]
MSAETLTAHADVRNLLTQAGAAYRQADFRHALALAQQALGMIEAMPARSSGTDRGRAVLIDSAYRRVVESLDRSNSFDEARRAVSDWLHATHRPEGQADALALSGRLLYRIGDFRQAMQHIEQGASIAESVGYEAGMAALLRFRADILWMRGFAEQALLSAQRAAALYEGLDDPEGKARTFNTLAAVYHTMGQYYRSILYGERAVKVLEALDDRLGLSIVYSNVGESYQQLFAMQEALDYHEKAAALSGDALSSDLVRNLGVDLVAVGRVDEGLHHLSEALSLAESEGETDTVFQCLHSLADARLHVGQYAEARALAERLLNAAGLLDAVRHTVRAVLTLGRCARARGDTAAAQQYFHEGFIAAQRVADKAVIWQAHASLAEILADSQPTLAKVHGKIASEMVIGILMSIEDERLQRTFASAPEVARTLSLGSGGAHRLS